MIFKTGLLSFPVVAVARAGRELGKTRFINAGRQARELTDKTIESEVKVILLVAGDAVLYRQSGYGSHRLFSRAENLRCVSRALLARCDLAVVNDGLCMAVAAGTTTVSIFGPWMTRFTAYQLIHRVVKNPIACRPCYRNFRRARCEHVGCLSRIAVEDVFREVGAIFSEPSFVKREA